MSKLGSGSGLAHQNLKSGVEKHKGGQAFFCCPYFRRRTGVILHQPLNPTKKRKNSKKGQKMNGIPVSPVRFLQNAPTWRLFIFSFYPLFCLIFHPNLSPLPPPTVHSLPHPTQTIQHTNQHFNPQYQTQLLT